MSLSSSLTSSSKQAPESSGLSMQLTPMTTHSIRWPKHGTQGSRLWRKPLERRKRESSFPSRFGNGTLRAESPSDTRGLSGSRETRWSTWSISKARTGDPQIPEWQSRRECVFGTPSKLIIKILGSGGWVQIGIVAGFHFSFGRVLFLICGPR